MAQEQTQTGKKKPYRAPTLTEYGNVAKLTEHKQGSKPDGKSGMIMVQGSDK
ncbi:MAG: lasso RiPP family leader peptide-containing protein [Nitrospirae bacterium]|nr:lasso RiPP family leader peptide-containing protein [Nitrospirota bacterium]